MRPLLRDQRLDLHGYDEGTEGALARILAMIRRISPVGAPPTLVDSDEDDPQSAAEQAERLIAAHALRPTGTLSNRQSDASTWLEFLQLALQDLQNPVAVLDMSMRLLVDDLAAADSQTLDTLRGIDHAVRRIQRYIDHLVTSEGFSSGRMEPRLERVNLTELLRDLADDFGRGARASGIDLRLDPAVPRDLLLCADETLLLRVFQSLLEHAVCRVIRDGRVHIHVQAENAVEVRVSNDGPPLTESERERMFEKYGARITGRRGWGPGLYFCRLAVEAHGGTVTVEPAAEWPTSFLVRLPMQPL